MNLVYKIFGGVIILSTICIVTHLLVTNPSYMSNYKRKPIGYYYNTYGPLFEENN